MNWLCNSIVCRCVNPAADLPDCQLDPSIPDEAEMLDLCAKITKTDGSWEFKNCGQQYGAEAQMFYDDCVFDVCEYKDKNYETKRKIACQSISAYVEFCASKNAAWGDLNWRGDSNSQAPCGNNQLS